jgi:hypothetical protein
VRDRDSEEKEGKREREMETGIVTIATHELLRERKLRVT